MAIENWRPLLLSVWCTSQKMCAPMEAAKRKTANDGDSIEVTIKCQQIITCGVSLSLSTMAQYRQEKTRLGQQNFGSPFVCIHRTKKKKKSVAFQTDRNIFPVPVGLVVSQAGNLHWGEEMSTQTKTNETEFTVRPGRRHTFCWQ